MKKIAAILLFGYFFFSFTPKKIQWTAIGDSITYLNEHADETGNRITKGYMTRVIEQMPGIQYLNQGHNGWTSGNIASGIDTLGLTKADLYTIFLGTNDWWAGRPLGTMAHYKNNSGNNTVYGSFRIIINKLRSLNDQAKIILITPMQRGDFVYIGDAKNNAYGSYKEKNNQSLASFADAIAAIGKYEHVPVVDLYHEKSLDMNGLVKFKRLKDPQTGSYRNYSYPAYIGVPFNPETDEYPYPPEAAGITYDGLHPSDRGFGVIAGMLLKTINTIPSLKN